MKLTMHHKHLGPIQFAVETPPEEDTEENRHELIVEFRKLLLDTDTLNMQTTSGDLIAFYTKDVAAFVVSE